MSVRRTFIFSLTLIDALLREVSDVGGVVSFSYDNFYGFVPDKYRRDSVYGITHSLKKDGVIASDKKGVFHLTEKGRQGLITESIRLEFINQPWDGKWRIVGFDVEENNRRIRDSFRRFLKHNGFGMVQKSLYVSPLPIENKVAEFLSSHVGVLGNAYIFVSENFFFGDRKVFLDNTFSISKLNDLYRSILKRINNDVAVEDRQKILRDFLEITSKDPLLPKELLPKDFVRDEVVLALQRRKIL
ncbi:MAG: CRISPR-associated endonuclease Cas2 [Armatimonadetes bacterium]|nr:MAG: CRISPR-associated endonuclease Cas2 [Armatimonadota bacterium]